MLRVNATNRQELLKRITFHSKSLVFKTVSVLYAVEKGHEQSPINKKVKHSAYSEFFLTFAQNNECHGDGSDNRWLM